MLKHGKKELLRYTVELAILGCLSWVSEYIYEGSGLFVFIFLTGVAILYEMYLHYFNLLNSIKSNSRELEKSNEAWHSVYSFLKFKKPIAQLSSFAASPDFAQYVMSHIMHHKPAVVYELGCGFSTLVIAKTAEMYSPETTLFSVEADEKYLNICSRDIESQGLKKYVEFIHAPYIDLNWGNKIYKYYTIPAVDRKIDLLVVDGPPRSLGENSRYPAMNAFKKYLAPGGFIICDDASREGMKKTIEQWKAENPDMNFQNIDLIRGACLISFKN